MTIFSTYKLRITGVSYALLVLFITACNSKPAEDEALVTSKTGLLEAAMEDEPTGDTVTYKNVSSCNACEGMTTTLKLFTHENKYSLSREHEEKHIADQVSEGSYNTERGFEKDEDATLYILNDKSPANQHIYFLRESSEKDQLTELDSTRKKQAGHIYKKEAR